MRFIVLVTVVLMLIWYCGELTVVSGDIGSAAPYHPPYTPTKCSGNSHDQFPPDNLFVAVGEGLWDNGAACGRMYRLTCLSGRNRPCRGGAIDVKVIDFCPKCSSTIVMSQDAFSAVSQPTDKIIIEFMEI